MQRTFPDCDCDCPAGTRGSAHSIGRSSGVSMSYFRTIASMLLAGTAVMAASAAFSDPIESGVVTGTRAGGHTEADSPVPITVYDTSRLADSGFSDIGQALDSLSPS